MSLPPLTKNKVQHLKDNKLIITSCMHIIPDLNYTADIYYCSICGKRIKSILKFV